MTHTLEAPAPVAAVPDDVTILRAFGHRGRTLVVADLARLLGIADSPEFRWRLEDMVTWDLLRRHQGGYCLGPRAFLVTTTL